MIHAGGNRATSKAHSLCGSRLLLQIGAGQQLVALRVVGQRQGLCLAVDQSGGHKRVRVGAQGLYTQQVAGQGQMNEASPVLVQPLQSKDALSDTPYGADHPSFEKSFAHGQLTGFARQKVFVKFHTHPF
jgi:hypothetical protein